MAARAGVGGGGAEHAAELGDQLLPLHRLDEGGGAALAVEALPKIAAELSRRTSTVACAWLRPREGPSSVELWRRDSSIRFGPSGVIDGSRPSAGSMIIATCVEGARFWYSTRACPAGSWRSGSV